MSRKYEIYDQAYKQDPFPALTAMQAEAPVFKQIGFDGETEMWFVTGYTEIQHVLKNNLIFSRDFEAYTGPLQIIGDDPFSQVMNKQMLNKEGDTHRRLRSLVGKAFSPRIVAQLRPLIESRAHALIDQVETAGSMDVMEQYAFPLPLGVLADLLGIPESDADFFRSFTNLIFEPPEAGEDQEAHQERFTLIALQFMQYITTMFADRRSNPQDDLISALVQIEEEGDKLSAEELFGTVILLITAGFETTMGALGNAVKNLLQNPEKLAELKQNPDLLTDAVEEMLRYDPAVERALTRYATEDTILAGAEIKQNDLVIPIITAGNRDASQFECPAHINFERESNKHLSFGHGVHYCLGAPLARMELEIGLKTLFDRLPTLRLATGNDPSEYTYSNSPMLHRLKSLQVVW